MAKKKDGPVVRYESPRLDTLYAKIGEAVRAARVEKKWTQDDVAWHTDDQVSSNYIGSVERGVTRVGIEELVIIARALRVPYKDLLP